MLAKEKVRLTALRAVKSEIRPAKTGRRLRNDSRRRRAENRPGVGQAAPRSQPAVYTEERSSRTGREPTAPKPPNSKVSCLLDDERGRVWRALCSSHYRAGGSQSAVRHGAGGARRYEAVGRPCRRPRDFRSGEEVAPAVETSEPPEYAAWMGAGLALEHAGSGAARKGTTRRYVRFRYRGQKGKWNRRYGSVFPIVGWRLCNFRAPSMFASGISVSASCGLRPQVAYPVGPLPMKSLPSGAVSYEETGNIWNSKTGTIRYAIGCRICRNAGGRRLRGCPSLRRMPRENRRRSGAGPNRERRVRVFSGTVPDVRFSSGKTGTVANRNG